MTVGYKLGNLLLMQLNANVISLLMRLVLISTHQIGITPFKAAGRTSYFQYKRNKFKPFERLNEFERDSHFQNSSE